MASGLRCRLADLVEIERLHPARRGFTAGFSIARQFERSAAGVENQSHRSSTHFALDLFSGSCAQVEWTRGFDVNLCDLPLPERQEFDLANVHRSRFVQCRAADAVFEALLAGLC